MFFRNVLPHSHVQSLGKDRLQFDWKCFQMFVYCPENVYINSFSTIDTLEGSITVQLRFRNQEVIFSVADTGVGIPEDGMLSFQDTSDPAYSIFP